MTREECDKKIKYIYDDLNLDGTNIESELLMNIIAYSYKIGVSDGLCDMVNMLGAEDED